MLRGNWQGRVLGSGSDAWKYWDDRQAGEIGAEKWAQIEAGIARSHGHCMTMGTASTMTAAAETLGMTLPGASSIPAADINHARMCAESGRRIVEMVWDVNFESNTNVVEVAIKRLRAKLDEPSEIKLLHTIRGMGYVLEEKHE